MLFRTEAFEQYFSERNLKRGYQLYEKGLISLLSRNNSSEARYHIANEEGVLRKRSASVISWDCSCGKDFCQHLAALMFNLHHSGLELPAKKTRKKQHDPQSHLPADSKVFSSGLQKLAKYGRLIHPLVICDVQVKGNWFTLMPPAFARISGIALHTIQPVGTVTTGSISQWL
jgi:hypothetical protein